MHLPSCHPYLSRNLAQAGAAHAGHGNDTGTWLRECYRQVMVEVVIKSRTRAIFGSSTYACMVQQNYVIRLILIYGRSL